MVTSHSKIRTLLKISLLVPAMVILLGRGGHADTRNSCVDCHSALPDELGVTAERFSQDIHAQRGLTCVSCHGGDASSDDPEKAMDRKAGFKGKPSRAQIPAFCGSCHSDPAYMRKFNPSLRTDQLSEYKTSVHGMRLAAGDTKVAVCIDCHGVHDLRAPSDPKSKVHPTNVATTCSRCHADAAYMSSYKIPTNQFASYNKSVHHQALAERGDLSAPTCTTCHGNHAASPPGVTSVANVCSNCHVFQAQLFASSPHQKAFAAAGLPGCVTCHSNHEITHPSDEFLGTGEKAVCMQCHTQGDGGYVAASSMKHDLDELVLAINRADAVLGSAERSGMEVSQPVLDMAQARDALMKARVSIHSSDVAQVQAAVKTGMKVAAAGTEAGNKALKERNYRRAGLGISLFAIVFALVGLRLYIRQIEHD